MNIFSQAEALRALRDGVRRGLVSRARRRDFPQNLWSVTADGIPLEAQLENRDAGTYHGYPMPENDALRDTVLRLWNAPQ